MDPLTFTEFQLDIMCRVAVSGFIETGLLGVVFISKADDFTTAQYVPVLTDSLASKWPEDFRQRLSADLMQDKMKSYFIIVQHPHGMNVTAIPREMAEEIVMRNNAIRIAHDEKREAEQAAIEDKKSTENQKNT